MQICKMSKSDAKELAELDKKCFSVPWSEKSFIEEAENDLATYYVFKESDKILGYCGVWKVSGEGQITNIAVLPECRKRGIASQLLEKIIDACCDEERIILEVRESNIPAICLYEKYGFVKVGIRKNFYHSPTENGITMIRGEN